MIVEITLVFFAVTISHCYNMCDALGPRSEIIQALVSAVDSETNYRTFDAHVALK